MNTHNYSRSKLDIRPLTSVNRNCSPGVLKWYAAGTRPSSMYQRYLPELHPRICAEVRVAFDGFLNSLASDLDPNDGLSTFIHSRPGDATPGIVVAEEYTRAFFDGIRELHDTFRARMSVEWGNSWRTSLRTAYEREPQPFDTYVPVMVSQLSLGTFDVHDFVARCLSVLCFWRDVRAVKSRGYLLWGNENPSLRFTRLTSDVTPKYFLDMEDLGYVHIYRRGNGVRYHSTRYLIPMRSDSHSLRWHMREASRLERNGYLRRRYMREMVAVAPPKPVTDAKDKLLRALFYGDMDADTRQLLDEAGVEVDGVVMQVLGLGKRVADGTGFLGRSLFGRRGARQMGGIIDGISGVIGACQKFVGDPGGALKDMIARLRKMMASPSSIVRIFVVCVVSGMMWEVVRSMFGTGTGLVRGFITSLLTGVLGTRKGDTSVSDVVSSIGFPADVQMQTGVSGSQSTMWLVGLIEIMLAKANLGRWVKNGLSAGTLISCLSELNGLEARGVRVVTEGGEVMRKSLKLFEGVVNKLLSLFTEKRVNLSGCWKSRLDFAHQVYSRLHPQYLLGRLPMYEPERHQNVQDTVQALSIVNELIISNAFARDDAPLRTLARGLAEIASVYRIDAATPQKSRVQPVSIVLAGPPGVGKSLLLANVAKAVLQNGIVDPALRNHFAALSDASLIYQKSSSKFWEGESGQPIYAFDDWMAMKGTPGEENDASTFIRLCNGWHMPLEMASVELKGKKYAHPYVVVATTNMQNIESDTNDLILHRDALRRRLNFTAKLEVKPEYWLPTSPTCLSVESNGIRVLDAGRYKAIVDEYAKQDQFPWHIHQVKVCEWGPQQLMELETISLLEFIKRAALGLRNNMSIHSGGGFNVPMRALEIDMDERPFIVEMQMDKHLKANQLAAECGHCKVAVRSHRIDARFSDTEEGLNSSLKQRYSDLCNNRAEALRATPEIVLDRIFMRISNIQHGRHSESVWLEKIITQLQGTHTVTVLLHDLVSGEDDGSLMSKITAGVDGVPSKIVSTTEAVDDMRFRMHTATGRPWGIFTDPADAGMARMPFGMAAQEQCMSLFGVSIAQLFMLFMLMKYAIIPVLKKTASLISGAVTGVAKAVTRHGGRKKVLDDVVTQRNATIEAPSLSTQDTIAHYSVAFWAKVDDTYVKVGHGLRVCGRNVLVPNHVLGTGCDMRITNGYTGHEASRYSIDLPRATLLSLPKVVSRVNKEIAMLHIPALPTESRRIFGRFPERNALAKFSAGLVAKVEVNNDRILVATSDRTKFLENKSVVYGDGHIDMSSVWEIRNMQNKPGDCGCVYYGTEHGTACVYAMHVSGSTHHHVAYALSLVREDIVEMVDAVSASTILPSVAMQCCGIPGQQAGGFPVVAQLPASDSMSFCPYSTLKRSLVADALAEVMGVPADSYMPARLRPYTGKDGEMVYPMERALKRYDTDTHVYDPGEVAEAVGVAFAPMSRARGLDPYDFETAVAGIPGMLKGIPRDRSNGIPRQTWTRRQAFGGDDYVFDTVGALEARADVMAMLEAANAGERPVVLYGDFPKDELLKKSKVEAGDTRLISPSPIAYYIAFRMVMGPLLVAADSSTMRLHNGLAIGLNPYTDWHYLMLHLLAYNSEGFAGDFAAFDACQQRQILEAVWLEMCRFFRDHHDVARRILGLELTDSLHVANARMGPAVDVYAWKQSLPSGHPGTAFINSYYNLTLFVMCFRRLTGRPMSEFWDYVRIVVLGDDNIVAPKPAISHLFNLVTVAAEMRRLGMTYTDAEKTGVLKPLVPLTECTFLKRGFVFADGEFRGPLAWTSLYKMCSHVRVARKTHRSEADLQQDNLDTLVREIALRGRAFYDERIADIVRVFHDQYGINPRMGVSYEAVIHSIVDAEPQWMRTITETAGR